MNFNYSYRAFLITSLLCGALFLVLYGFKLSNYKENTDEKYDFEYAVDNVLVEEISENMNNGIAVKTNRAYNEAEEYISEIENERNDTDENVENKLSEIDAAIDNTAINETSLKKAKRKLEETKLKIANTKQTDLGLSEKAITNKNTTISYRLVKRRAVYLPSPVYTCQAGGIIVINIQVNELGKVIRTYFNERSSTSSDGCLIDSALEYATKARFNTKADRLVQGGSIKYNFPGQN